MTQNTVCLWPVLSTSGIRESQRFDRVAYFLKAYLKSGAQLSVFAEYVTIYANSALEERLAHSDHMDSLFGDLTHHSRSIQ